VKRNALRKARDVARREGSGVVIAADTVVMAGGKLIGKPHTLRGAARMLKALSRKRQWVYTGLAVVDADTGRAFTACEETAIRMRPMSDASISWYFRKVSPLDKAGGFDVRGAGAVFVEQIEGCFYNVVGLPLARLARMLEKVGVDIL
jgi:septum formation protein